MQLKTICFAILFFVQIILGHALDHHDTTHSDRCISALKKKIFKGTSMSLRINSTNPILQIKGLGKKEIKTTIFYLSARTTK